MLDEIEQRRRLLETIVACHAFIGFQLDRNNLTNEERAGLRQFATWIRDRGTAPINGEQFPISLRLVVETMNTTLTALAQGAPVTELSPLLSTVTSIYNST